MAEQYVKKAMVRFAKPHTMTFTFSAIARGVTSSRMQLFFYFHLRLDLSPGASCR